MKRTRHIKHWPRNQGLMKLVRIDEKTSIEVQAFIPDEEARQRYLLKLSRNAISR
jgi:hypothetical protein